MKTFHLVLAFLLSLLIFSTSYAQNTSDATTKLPNDEGIVASVLETTGYTYMELENGSRLFWIAAPTTQVKVGDHVRFVESMAMTNFSSKTLNRTFHRIIFVSSTMIKK